LYCCIEGSGDSAYELKCSFSSRRSNCQAHDLAARMAFRLLSLTEIRFVSRSSACWEVVWGVEKIVLRVFIWKLSRRLRSCLGNMSMASPYSSTGRRNTLYAWMAVTVKRPRPCSPIALSWFNLILAFFRVWSLCNVVLKPL
jgi:hypothetical protein